MNHKNRNLADTNRRWLLVHALDAAKLFEKASEMAILAAETKLEAVRLANQTLDQSGGNETNE
ncbi:MAG: hypothetical protein AAFN77_24240 [Planctomycetota bacterium]